MVKRGRNLERNEKRQQQQKSLFTEVNAWNGGYLEGDSNDNDNKNLKKALGLVHRNF